MGIYDVVIIGAGPAGLSAAIYLARFRRKVLLIDAEKGRSTLPGTYANIMGFPQPVERKEYRRLGAQQAVGFGAEKVCEEVKDIKFTDDGNFELICEGVNYFAKYIIFCTGVLDKWPQIEGYEEYIGYSLHSCPLCAGYETIGKRVIAIGYNHKITQLALLMMTYTDKLVLTTNGMPLDIEEHYLEKIKKVNIPFYTNKIVKLIGKNKKLEKVVFDDGRELEADYIFSALGVKVNSSLAQKLGVEVDECGYIKIDQSQKTNINKVYAAGDVTTFDHKQVVTSVYEGFMAAYSVDSEILKEKIAEI